MHSDLYMNLDEFSSIVNELNIDLYFEKDKETNIKYMKDVLEELRKMPVLNPKTGEEDHVDINLIEKIIVDQEFFQDMTKNIEIKVDIKLVGKESSQTVHISALNENHGIQEEESISLQTFEEMLFEAIHENKNQRLEEVEAFQKTVDLLLDRSIESARKNNNQFLARRSREYILSKGVGIIADIKTNQKVGTFESIRYTYEKYDYSCKIEDVLLYGRSYKDLKDLGRFSFSFYSLEHGINYNFISDSNSDITTSEKESLLSIVNFNFSPDPFDNNHDYYQIITESEDKKDLIKDIDPDHPLYDERIESFRKSRLLILEESKKKQKQMKLVSQFSDIEFDL